MVGKCKSNNQTKKENKIIEAIKLLVWDCRFKHIDCFKLKIGSS